MKRILLLTLLATAIAPLAPAQTMFHGDPAHTGVYATEGPKQLKGVKWAFQTGGAVVSSPTVADGVAYVGSDDKQLYAIDLATGKEKWKFATGGPVRATPAVAAGLVYAGSYDGVFYAVDAATGKEKWKFAMPGEKKFEARGLHGCLPRAQIMADFWDLYISSPAVVDGVVYVGCGDGNCYALDAATGQLKWKFETKGVVHSSPAVVDGAVYFGSWDTYLYAVDAKTGQEKWKFKTGEDPVNFNQTGIQSSPAIVDGVIYFGCRDSHVYAVDAATGQEKWKYQTDSGAWVNASAAVVDGSVYFGTSDPAFFVALDARTGKERFKSDAHVPVFSSPAVAGGLAYFGSFNGSLYAVNLKDGKLAWEFQTESAKKNAPAYLAADGHINNAAVFLSSFFEDMYHASTKLFSLGSIVSSPVVDHGVVYVGSADGNLYALE
jgi:eukaryotic-like serine/threonine-protein kinase